MILVRISSALPSGSGPSSNPLPFLPNTPSMIDSPACETEWLSQVRWHHSSMLPIPYVCVRLGFNATALVRGMSGVSESVKSSFAKSRPACNFPGESVLEATDVRLMNTASGCASINGCTVGMLYIIPTHRISYYVRVLSPASTVLKTHSILCSTNRRLCLP
jgi:hypothetical protein